MRHTVAYCNNFYKHKFLVCKREAEAFEGFDARGIRKLERSKRGIKGIFCNVPEKDVALSYTICVYHFVEKKKKNYS